MPTCPQQAATAASAQDLLRATAAAAAAKSAGLGKTVSRQQVVSVKGVPVRSIYENKLYLQLRNTEFVEAGTVTRALRHTEANLYSSATWTMLNAAGEPRDTVLVSADMAASNRTVIKGLEDPLAPAATVSVSSLWPTGWYDETNRLEQGSTTAEVNAATRTVAFTEPTCSVEYVQTSTPEISGDSVVCSVTYQGRLVAAPLRFATATYVSAMATSGDAAFRSPMTCQLDLGSKVTVGECVSRPAGITRPAAPAVQSLPIRQYDFNYDLQISSVDTVVDGRVTARAQPAGKLLLLALLIGSDAADDTYFQSAFTQEYAGQPGALRVSGLPRNNARRRPAAWASPAFHSSTSTTWRCSAVVTR